MDQYIHLFTYGHIHHTHTYLYSACHKQLHVHQWHRNHYSKVFKCIYKRYDQLIIIASAFNNLPV